MLNHTFVALIPKKPSPDSITECLPISLCNVAYKLVTKVISNRLQPLLPRIILDTQVAFTQGMWITDNNLIAFQIFNAMKGDGSANGAMESNLTCPRHLIEWSGLSYQRLC